ncbi:MAG: hypothetical protein AB1Z66_15200 [Candidatus Limnocylindrales bacterium]
MTAASASPESGRSLLDEPQEPQEPQEAPANEFPKQRVRNLARAWVYVVWRCWQDGVPCDPQRHRALQTFIGFGERASPRPIDAQLHRTAVCASI